LESARKARQQTVEIHGSERRAPNRRVSAAPRKSKSRRRTWPEKEKGRQLRRPFSYPRYRDIARRFFL
jgi:hypothetical protein